MEMLLLIYINKNMKKYILRLRIDIANWLVKLAFKIRQTTMTLQHLIDTVEKKFDKRINSKNYLDLKTKDSLLKSHKYNNEDWLSEYPESEYELDSDKIKKFYRSSFYDMVREVCLEVINVKYPNNGCEWSHDESGIEKRLCDQCIAIDKTKKLQRANLDRILKEGKV
jgi:hypothetical protein